MLLQSFALSSSQPGIRTNTTVCLGKIATSLPPAVCVLINIFITLANLSHTPYFPEILGVMFHLDKFLK